MKRIKKVCVCGKVPSFNYLGEKKPIYCSKCKFEGMIDVVHKRCPCGHRPSFGYMITKKPICCSMCKLSDMVNVKHDFCECGNRPSFNFLGEKKPICCFNCKTSDMINVKKVPCHGYVNHNTNQGEPCPFGHRGSLKYEGYCSKCHSHNFPYDPLTFQMKCKTKEIAVRDFINSTFDGFYHDKVLETSHCDCTVRRRIDHRKIIGNTLLAIETDENQHKSYDSMDEETRYNDLFMAYSGKWIYIRFNPDRYKNSKGQNRNPPISTRLAKLKEEIEKQIHRIENEENKELIERIYLYFDGYE